MKLLRAEVPLHLRRFPLGNVLPHGDLNTRGSHALARRRNGRPVVVRRAAERGVVVGDAVPLGAGGRVLNRVGRRNIVHHGPAEYAVDFLLRRAAKLCTQRPPHLSRAFRLHACRLHVKQQLVYRQIPDVLHLPPARLAQRERP